ncbi:DUF6989 domain-containing protein [Aquimarina algiphila]|uniref:DUF6989 domain-containing protein n=1 Tax=Aquimarina algiphila TaxID=2047982 RepID=A0A554VIM0_9FLAO|nr:hypothetical protein [Aquimarina algiphila]TSE07655.1 hypothetical protein FOF46_15245 [Aquimarina algiphila]
MITIQTLLEKKTFNATEFNKKTTLFIDITQIILILWTIGSSITQAGSISAGIITYILYPIYLVYAITSKNNLILKLIVFGTSCGILELFADHYAAITLDSLVYPMDEPMLWTSPLYMPFAWSNVLVQMGYLSLRLIQWKGIAIASGIIAISGGVYIFFYENMAKSAGWWYYQNASMLFNTPHYISIAEVLLFITLPISIYVVYKKNIAWSLVLGSISGLWILAAAIFAYTIAP